MTDPTASDDWAALVNGIRDDPDNDLRRLVAADWLDDHGCHGRADLIRLQVEGAPHRDWVGLLEQECAALLARFGDRWTFDFERGFIAGVSCAMRVWCGDKCDCEVTDGQNSHVGFRKDCPKCGGKGYHGGIGPAVVRLHPVRELTTDREPTSFFGRQALAWLRSATWDRRDSLPSRIYKRLRRDKTSRCGTTLWAELMPDRAAWEKATSDAAIAWALSEVS